MSKTTIRSKPDLQQWLKSIGVSKSLNDLPDIKPLRKSKWLNFERDWSYDEVYYCVGRNSHLSGEAVGGYIKCIIDVMYQGSTARASLVRTKVGNQYYTRITAIPSIELPKSQLDACSSIEELVNVINDSKQLKYTISINEEPSK